ncbi:unnamed protein product, partial [Mesorhabditis belari]|uniref:Uncharacterized protein n=1 Tax=Mesorhabditis belari TaxID=2138241 RepID=A0AAF3FD31_9BILA
MEREVADLRAQLGFGAESVRVNAFANVVKNLEHKDERKKKEYHRLFWQCVNEYGDYISSLAEKIISSRLQSSAFSNEAVITEMMAIFSAKKPGSRRILRFLLHQNGDLSRICAQIYSRVPEMLDEMIEEMKGIDWERARPAVLSFLCMETLSESHRVILAEYLLEKETEKASPLFVLTLKRFLPQSFLRRLPPSQLVYEHCIKEGTSLSVTSPVHLMSRAKQTLCQPNLLKIAEAHPCNLPVFLTLVASIGELAKVASELVDRNVLDQVKQLILEIQSWRPTFLIAKDEGQSITNFDYFERVVGDGESLTAYFQRWLKMNEWEINDDSISFLIGALAFVKQDEHSMVFRLLEEFCRRKAEFTPISILCLLTIYSRPWFSVSKEAIIECIGRVTIAAKNTLVVSPALRFLLAVCQKVSLMRSSFLCMVKPEDGHSRWTEARLELAATICKHSELSDELLPSLSTLLTKGGPLLPAVLRVIKVLCEEGVFEIPVIANQSRTRSVHDPKALSEHARILALSRVESNRPQEELDEEEAENLQKNQEFAQQVALPELWTMTGHLSEIVRDAAFESLTNFSLEEIYVHIDSITENENEEGKTVKMEKLSDVLLDQVLGNDVERSEGLTKFLHRAVAEDLESLPRPLINEDEDPLFPTTFAIYETKQNEDADLNFLSILSIILKGIPIDKRPFLAKRMLTKCLIQISTPSTNSPDFPKYLSAWRSLTETCLEVFAKSHLEQGEPSFTWARDQLCEELRRALLQAEDSLSNVLTVLIYMALKLSNVHESSSSNPYRPWLISVIEFLCLVKDWNHNPRMNPIFQCVIKSISESKKLARLGLMLFSKHLLKSDLSFYQGNSLVNDEQAITREMFGNDGEWAMYLIDGTATSSESTMVSREKSTLIGYSLGLAPMTLEVEANKTTNPSLQMPKFESIEHVDTVHQIFNHLSEVDSTCFEANRRKVKKALEMVIKKKDVEMGKAVWKGLSSYSLSQCDRVLSKLPLDYAALPENSLLRAVERRIRVITTPAKRDVLLKSLTNQCRKNDGRNLPPIDISHLISYANDVTSWITVFQLAVQQKHSTLIARLISRKSALKIEADFTVIETLAKNFEEFHGSIPERSQRQVANHLLNQLESIESQNREILSERIGELSKIPIFCQELTTFLTKPTSCLEIEKALWKTIEGKANQQIIGDTFLGTIVACWLECSKESRALSMGKIVEILRGSTKSQSQTIACLIGDRCSLMSFPQMILIFSDALTQAKVLIAKGDKPVLLSFWPIIVSLIVSIPSPIPFQFVREDDEKTVELAARRVQYHLDFLLARDEFASLIEPLASYLLTIIPDLQPPHLQGAKDCFRMLLGKRSLPQIDNDAKWRMLFA